MLFFATSSKFQHHITIIKLSDLSPEAMVQQKMQIAKWVEDKWGYMRGFPGLEERKKLITKVQDYLYLLIYANRPIGMFALFDHPVTFNHQKRLMGSSIPMTEVAKLMSQVYR